METLRETIRVQVRFSEVDALRKVWHGHYLQYMEDAREAFGYHVVFFLPLPGKRN